MALQIRRGTDASRAGTIFKSGELIYTTDQKDLWVGDNATTGGIQVAPVKSVNGSTGTVVLTTTQLQEGTNLYYTSARAKLDAGAALTGGNAGNSGITFTWNSGSQTITASVSAGGYSLPIAATSTLGGVKINAGGLSIDGAGLLSVSTPVSTGVASQIPYYTNTNIVGPSGTGLTWATTAQGGYTGGQLTVTGVVDTGRINMTSDLATGGLVINTQQDGTSSVEVFSVLSAHNGSTPTSARFIRSRGTVASGTTLNSTDPIFGFDFIGGTSGTPALAAQLRATVNGTVSSGVVPGKFVFSTADSSGALQNSFNVASDGISVTGNLVYTGLRISPANFITVSSTATYVLSTTKHKNILLVGNTGYTATLTMPTSPVDGQLCIISVHTNNVTLAMTAGPTLSGTFAGSVTAPTTFEYIYRASNTTWYRIQ
jgi:hypothetical protein